MRTLPHTFARCASSAAAVRPRLLHFFKQGFT
jgi:hypothetical protein